VISPLGVLFHYCAAPCSAARCLFDHFKIWVSTLRFELTQISKWSNRSCAELHGAAQQWIWIPSLGKCIWLLLLMSCSLYRTFIPCGAQHFFNNSNALTSARGLYGEECQDSCIFRLGRSSGLEPIVLIKTKK
jgi:hypothetical protein